MILFAPLSKIYITQLFGKNPSMYRIYGMKGHNGLDLRTKFAKTPLGHRYVRSMASGVVVEIGNQGRKGYGVFIRIQHDDGSQTVYGHLSKVYAPKGSRVKRTSLERGTIIGLTDNTGKSTGSHLHAGYRPPNWRKIYNNGFKGYVNFYNNLIK